MLISWRQSTTRKFNEDPNFIHYYDAVLTFDIQMDGVEPTSSIHDILAAQCDEAFVEGDSDFA